MAPPLVFVIGGTGAQGLPIVEALVKDGQYAVRVLTRDKTSLRSRKLATLSPNVSFLEGSFASEENLRAGYAGADYAFVNIDGKSRVFLNPFTSNRYRFQYWRENGNLLGAKVLRTCHRTGYKVLHLGKSRLCTQEKRL